MKKWIMTLMMVTGLLLATMTSACATTREPGEGKESLSALLARLHESVESDKAKAERAKSQKAESGKRLLLVWQPRFGKDESLVEGARPAGVGIASPCWFSLTEDGGVKAVPEAKKDYVDKAHGLGYKVWALVTNGGFDPEVAHRILSSETARARAVDELKSTAKKFSLDGINLDFENIDLEDRDALTGFVKEISDALHAEGLVVSIDVTVPSNAPNWSLCYDREALAKSVDYVALMAYDENSRGSRTSGPVASLPWVERGVKNTLAQGVPPQKLLLGMPSYMRLWEEKDGKVEKVTTLSMPDAEKLVKEKKLAPKWDSELGAFYFEYREGGSLFRVWQENARSLALKAALVNRYDLAGAAIWRRGFETPDIWPVLETSLAAIGG